MRLTLPDAMKIDAPLSPTIVIEFSVASAGRELVPVRQGPTLEERAASINAHIHKYTSADISGHKHRLKAGAELLAARKLIPHGEWLAWCERNIVRGQRDFQRLMKLAGAPDPDKALDEERAENAERKREARSKATDVRRISEPVEIRDCDRAALANPLDPAELFSAVAPALDAMSDDDVRAFSVMITEYMLIDRPERGAGDPSAAARKLAQAA